MRGRFVTESPLSKITRELHTEEPSFEYKANYNIAPGQDVVTVKGSL